MKKRVITGVVIAAMLVAQVMTTFAARSGSSEDSTPTVSQSSVNTVVTVGTTGTKTTEALTSTSAAGGTSISIVVDTTTPTGQKITLNAKGEAVIGDQALSFAKGGAETAGLPEQAVADINAINSGKELSSFIKGFSLTTSFQATEDGKVANLDKAPQMDLTGYHALTGTTAIVTKDAATGVVEDKVTEAVVYVPNLIDGLQNVSILYYDNATGRWLLLAPTMIDPVTKLVYVNVTGSGTLAVIYKR